MYDFYHLARDGILPAFLCIIVPQSARIAIVMLPELGDMEKAAEERDMAEEPCSKTRTSLPRLGQVL